MPDDSPTRQTILDAAERLFARQGFTATTIKQIGAEAGVNTALLYYYFADKETLYREMLRRMVAAFADAGVRQLEPASSPADGIRRLVGFQVEFTIGHPQLVQLLMRELLDHDAAHAEEQITHLSATLFKRLCELVEQGQRDGNFRADFDPRYAAISTIAQVVYFTVALPAVAVLLGHKIGELPEAERRAFGRHAAEFALAALGADSSPAKRPATPKRAAATRSNSKRKRA